VQPSMPSVSKGKKSLAFIAQIGRRPEGKSFTRSMLIKQPGWISIPRTFSPGINFRFRRVLNNIGFPCEKRGTLFVQPCLAYYFPKPSSAPRSFVNQSMRAIKEPWMRGNYIVDHPSHSGTTCAAMSPKVTIHRPISIKHFSCW